MLASENNEQTQILATVITDHVVQKSFKCLTTRRTQNVKAQEKTTRSKYAFVRLIQTEDFTNIVLIVLK